MRSQSADHTTCSSDVRRALTLVCGCALVLGTTIGCQSKSEKKPEQKLESKAPPAAAAQSAPTAAPSVAMRSEVKAKSMAAPRSGATASRGPEMSARIKSMMPEMSSPIAEESPEATPGPPDVSVPTPEQTKVDVDRSGKGTIVKLFYATDRAPIDVPLATGLSADAWYRLTIVSAASCMLTALGAFRWPRRRWWKVISAAGLMMTAGTGAMTIYARNLPETANTDLRCYGNHRGELELGTCEVSVPEGHTVGEMERPSLLRFEFSENPLKHVVLVSSRCQDELTFYSQMQQRVGESKRKEAIVFVHGYNVSFDVAARRMAQIAHDLRFDGAPILYSWPSQGGLLGYTVDETNVQWTVPHLKDFLVDVSKRSGAQAVHLVAHSMGNRALTSALRDLFYELDAQCPKFNEVVLTAPDIDADVFRHEIAPAIVKTARRVTLYASSNDEALLLSKKVHGYSRAGDSGDELVVVPGMDTIDVSAIDTSMLGHSYYGNNETVLADLYDLLRESKPAEQRKSLRPVRLGQLRYWIFSR